MDSASASVSLATQYLILLLLSYCNLATNVCACWSLVPSFVANNRLQVTVVSKLQVKSQQPTGNCELALALALALALLTSRPQGPKSQLGTNYEEAHLTILVLASCYPHPQSSTLFYPPLRLLILLFPP